MLFVFLDACLLLGFIVGLSAFRFALLYGPLFAVFLVCMDFVSLGFDLLIIFELAKKRVSPHLVGLANKRTVGVGK